MSQPNFRLGEKVNNLSLNDVSFDDEFRLLETTLTGLKENDSKIEGDSKNDTLLTNDSGIFSLNLVEITPIDSLQVYSEDVTRISLKSDETNLIPQEFPNACLPRDIISSTNSKSTPPSLNILFENLEDINNAHMSPLPTTQLFKSTGKCNESLTNLSLVSSSENFELKCATHNSVSNCDVLSGIMQSSSKLLSSVKKNIDNNHDELNSCNISDVSVAPCDSSFVENQEKTRPIEVSEEKSLQGIAEDQLNICKKFLPDKQDGLNLKCQEPEKFETSEADITNCADPDLGCYPESVPCAFKTAPAVEIENKNLELNQICKLSQVSQNTISGDTISANNNIHDLKQDDIMVQSTESKEAIALCKTVKTSSDRLAVSTSNCLESSECCELLTSKNKLNDTEILTCRKDKAFFEDGGQRKNEQASSDDRKETATFFCSTPITSNIFKENVEDSIEPNSDHLSPLNRPTNYLKSKMNLKRTNLCLERIEEIDESTDGCSDKRLKLSSPTFENKIDPVFGKNDENVSSSMTCFEPPAKSILKKWDPGCLSRDSFFILDECGETDSEETIKPSQESADQTSVVLDDFEVACKSLAEELLMSSSNFETLEKYNSQVQLDSQMDDKKFFEALQEMTLNYEMEEKMFLSKMKPNEDSKCLTRENVTNYSHMNMEESLNDTENKANPSSLVSESKLSEDKNILAEVKGLNSVSGADDLSIKHEDNPETSSCTQQTMLICENERVVTVKGTDEKFSIDEEDVLLEEDIKVEQKQYVYFEYVSSDPKENEDNYNPEWQKLGKLTCDEER